MLGFGKEHVQLELLSTQTGSHFLHRVVSNILIWKFWKFLVLENFRGHLERIAFIARQIEVKRDFTIAAAAICKPGVFITFRLHCLENIPPIDDCLQQFTLVTNNIVISGDINRNIVIIGRVVIICVRLILVIVVISIRDNLNIAKITVLSPDCGNLIRVAQLLPRRGVNDTNAAFPSCFL